MESILVGLTLAFPLCPLPQFSMFGSRTAGRPTRCVSGDQGGGYGLSKAEFMEKVQQSNEACQRGDFQAAVRLYTSALQADPQNCILYSNRSAARLKLGQHQAALDDAEKACELNPKWPKVSVPSRHANVVLLPRFSFPFHSRARSALAADHHKVLWGLVFDPVQAVDAIDFTLLSHRSLRDQFLSVMETH